MRSGRESSTPLVALGEAGEHVGAGRIFSSDREWRQVVAKLCQAAARILVLPASSHGTLWEIDWLKRNRMFDKCAFLLPPQPNASDLDMAKEWDLVTVTAVQFSLVENKGLTGAVTTFT